VGLNCLVIAGLDKDIKLGEVFRGAGWFVVMEIIITVILFFFPVIVTLLPDSM
jgi:TRAP-type C4-dicarboxylate transport system permease large subunit